MTRRRRVRPADGDERHHAGVFEHGNVTAPCVAMLRKQLLALCRGYLTAAASTNARDSLNPDAKGTESRKTTVTDEQR